MSFSISCVLGVGKFAVGYEDGYAGGQGMDTPVRELVDVREELIPEVLHRLDSCPNGIYH